MLQVFDLSKRIIAKFLIFAILITHLWSFAPAPSFASTSPNLSQLKQEFIEQAKKYSSDAVDEALKLKGLTVAESTKSLSRNNFMVLGVD